MIDYTKIGKSGHVLHETRKAILEYIDKHKMASPNEISEATGLNLSNISYHVKAMREYKRPWLILARTEPRRGALEHFYKAGSGCPLTKG